MKISPQQYALALFEALKDADKKQADKRIREFARVLVESNQVSCLSDVIRRFEDMWNRHKGVVSSRVATARDLDAESRKAIKALLEERTGKKTIEISYDIDEKIIGGAVIKYDSKILDASLKTRLTELKEVLQN